MTRRMMMSRDIPGDPAVNRGSGLTLTIRRIDGERRGYCREALRRRIRGSTVRSPPSPRAQGKSGGVRVCQSVAC